MATTFFNDQQVKLFLFCFDLSLKSNCSSNLVRNAEIFITYTFNQLDEESPLKLIFTFEVKHYCFDDLTI